MYGWNDDRGSFWNAIVVESWKYESGDWVVEPGLPDHHLRIVQQFLDAQNVRWYGIFDTSLRENYGDYRWRQANELEPKSRLKARPEPDQVPAILERTAFCRGIEWSMLARTDCESIQGWIHSGNENDRWSPQVWMGIGLGVLGVIALASGQPKQRRRYR
jgi:hypothetical protein